MTYYQQNKKKIARKSMGRENDCGKEKASECSRKIARVI